MPKSCCVHGCNANKKLNPERQFYIIPSGKTRREKWLAAINRAVYNPDGTVNKTKRWSPQTGHCYVCSAHFITGAKVNVPGHPDYVPTVFKPVSESKHERRGKSSVKLDRFERASKRISSTSRLDGQPRARKQLKFIDDNANIDTQSHSSKDGGLADNEHDEYLFAEEDEILVATKVLPLKRPLANSEREILHTEIENLRIERDSALEKVSSLEKVLTSSSLTSSSVAGNNETCRMMIGISWDVFLKLFIFLSSCVGGSGKSVYKSSLPLKEQLFLTLVKLRHNVSFDFLAHVKGIPKSTIIDYFWKWIDLLHAKIGFMVKWQDRDTIFKTIPPVFKGKFPRLTSIIDCFEIFIEAPKNLLARAQCYSSYKKHCTVKVLISCTPLGSINFISKAWGGRASDIKIVRGSQFIDPRYHFPGDQILADRGFTLKDDFASMCSAELLIPAFTKGKKQLPAKDVETSRKISSVRIHIERVIGLLKNRFNILKGIMPIRCVQSIKDESIDSTLSNCDKILKVCASLTNLGSGIVFKE